VQTGGPSRKFDESRMQEKHFDFPLSNRRSMPCKGTVIATRPWAH